MYLHRTIRYTLRLLLIFCSFLSSRSQTIVGEEEPRSSSQGVEQYKFRSYIPIVEKEGLPRILILGDSISIGYTIPVRTRLKERANVLRPAENCGDTSTGLARLNTWLAAGNGNWDVIHFNFGLHDLKYLDAKGNYVSPEIGTQVTSLIQYEDNLRKIVSRLKQTKAKLIFATTTPVPIGAKGRLSEDPERFNAAARRVMQEEHIEINDLFEKILTRQTELQQPKNVHFTDAGYEMLSVSVASSIEAALRRANLNEPPLPTSCLK
jgi:acyl-CoA thioesterase-1